MATNPIWEEYGLSEEEWNTLTEEEKTAYLQIGTLENQSTEEEYA